MPFAFLPLFVARKGIRRRTPLTNEARSVPQCLKKPSGLLNVEDGTFVAVPLRFVLVDVPLEDPARLRRLGELKANELPRHQIYLTFR
jgi:hypothetical protein